MKRVLLTVTILATLAACNVDRPEGVVERWLTAIAQGPTGEPEVYASNELTDDLVPPPRQESALEVIEVGKGRTSGTIARVPFRIQRPDKDPQLGVAELRRDGGEWQIVTVSRADSNLSVPTEGGERVGRASVLDWVVGAAAGILMMLAVAVIMRLVTPARSPT